MNNLPGNAFSLKAVDFLKGAILAVIVPALMAIQQAILNPPIVWKPIGILALSTFIGYLIKNFFTNDVPAAQKTVFDAEVKMSETENKRP